MKVILSVPDEGYSRHVSCALNLIFTFLLNIKITFTIYFYRNTENI